MDGQWRDAEFYVCHDCVTNDAVCDAILRDGRLTECSFCGSEVIACMDVAALATLVEDRFREIADEGPFAVLLDKVPIILGGPGDRSTELMNGIVGARDENIGRALVRRLFDRHVATKPASTFHSFPGARIEPFTGPVRVVLNASGF